MIFRIFHNRLDFLLCIGNIKCLSIHIYRTLQFNKIKNRIQHKQKRKYWLNYKMWSYFRGTYWTSPLSFMFPKIKQNECFRLCFIFDFTLRLNCDTGCEHTQHTHWMPSLHHHSDLVAMKSTFISALCWQTPLGRWTKHKQTGHKQLLLLLVTWVNASLHMLVIQRERGDKTPLITASTTLTTHNEAYGIRYRTCSLTCLFFFFFKQSF